jgi:EAL domain-containing protein (putative c-di-GMP-specific phosphodiesterase class I)/PleD family two-component response regulator
MKTILVIDDEHLICNNVVKLLAHSGFQGIGAKDGLEGIQMAKAYVPDLIVCDVAMSGIDGYEVLTTLRQDPKTMGIPVIFLSAKADRGDIRQGMNLGADDYLTKPFTSQELIETIQARLQKQASLALPYLNEMQRTTAVLGSLAHQDPLTNLPNRIFFHHHLQEVIGQAKENRQPIAVLSVKLDRVEPINSQIVPHNLVGDPLVSDPLVSDPLAHHKLTTSVCDRLVQWAAERLTEWVGNKGTVARLDDLTFGVVLSDVQREKSAEHAQTIMDVLTGRVQLSQDPMDNHAYQIRTAIGIALFPEHGRAPGQLLARAERGMQSAQQPEGHAYQFYHPSMKIEDIQRRSLEADLETAIQRSELQLYYQPQVSLLNGRMIGMEALLRWHHPRKGVILPDKFIPLAEKTGLILPIGEWVLQTACAQTHAWRLRMSLPLQVAVNLSIHQFRQTNLVKTVLETLQQTKLNPRLLVLELPEVCLTSDSAHATITLQKLREAGVSVNVDDFGTGLSCLTSLGQLPIDSLKIDRSFVAHLPHSAYHAELVKALLRLSQSFKLRAIAEGIETQEQLTFFQEYGCYGMQGYLYSRPLPAPEFEHWLTNHQPLASHRQLV